MSWLNNTGKHPTDNLSPPARLFAINIDRKTKGDSCGRFVYPLACPYRVFDVGRRLAT